MRAAPKAGAYRRALLAESLSAPYVQKHHVRDQPNPPRRTDWRRCHGHGAHAVESFATAESRGAREPADVERAAAVSLGRMPGGNLPSSLSARTAAVIFWPNDIGVFPSRVGKAWR
jgi:hypothetical protein